MATDTPKSAHMRRVLAWLIAVLFGFQLVANLPALASHADGSYDLPIWFQWNKTVLDVIVVPPNHGQITNDNGVLNGGQASELTPFNTYLKAIEDSIANWDEAVSMFGSDSLKSRFVTNVYVVGRDSVPPDALTNPEIIVTTDETKGSIYGVAVSTNTGSPGSTPCVVDNSKFLFKSFTYEDMYSINSHEYGHCLGLWHIVDNHPEHDSMAGTFTDPVGAKGNHLRCVSNLDVMGLEAVFGSVLGQPSPGSVSIPVDEYGTTCEPPGAASVPEEPEASPSPSDSPSPSSSQEPDPEESPSGEQPEGSPSHDQHLRTITLRLDRHLIATGSVTVDDDYMPCATDVTVRILVRRAGAWKFIRSTTTTAAATFRLRLPDRGGAYRAELKATSAGDRDNCSAALSRTARHSHRH